MKKLLIASVILSLVQFADAAFTRLVPEDGISKAFTLKSDGDNEYVVRFYRPNVFRLEVAKKLWEGDETNRTYRLDFADKLNNPNHAQILLDNYAEDMTSVKFADKDDKFTFKTTEMIVEFDKLTEIMSVYDYYGKKIFTETEAISIATNETIQTLASAKDVRYYGGGQQVGKLMHKGRKLKIDCDYEWAEGGVPNPVPFLISSEGFGLMRHTFSAGEYDLTAEETASLKHDEVRFDCFYFIGNFKTILDRYTEATGRPNLLPMWALELGDADAYITRENDTKYPKQEKDGEFTELTPMVANRVAMKYRDMDMPGGWILVNDGYGCGHILLGSTVRELYELGFHTGLWTEGKLDRIAWEVSKAGTRVQKLDVAWTAQGGDYKMQHALQCNKDAYLGITTNVNARAFVWSVLGWAGSQRYSIAWSGDQYGGWDLIRYMIPTITGSAMSAQAYASADVDGIFGGSNETYLRDLQWKCWTTAMYVMNGWSHVNKSPWSYPEPYRSLIRDALKKKIRLTPFFYTLMRNAWESGEPIIRPMVWNYPFAAEENEDFDEKTKYQFMVGDSIIVAPIYTPMSVNKGWWRKGIYIPEGEWYDYNDGRQVNGDQMLMAYPIELDKIPVFVRAGSIIPMYPEALTTSGADISTLTFDIWPDHGRGACTIYEDDGETLNYLHGAYSLQQLVAIHDEVPFRYELSPVMGEFDGKLARRKYEFMIHTQAEPEMVLLDGVELKHLTTTNCIKRLYANVRQGWYYDKDEKFGTLMVKLAPRSTEVVTTLEVRFPNGELERVMTPDYPVPSVEEEEAADEPVKKPAIEFVKDTSLINGADMVVKDGKRVTIGPMDGTFIRITGHVATHPDNDDDARFTFTILADDEKIFERANMKGGDVPQLIAVDIPANKHWIKFDFKADDETLESKNAKGVWKNVEFITE